MCAVSGAENRVLQPIQPCHVRFLGFTVDLPDLTAKPLQRLLNTPHTVGREAFRFSLVFVMAGKGIFQLHHTAIKTEIQIAGDVAVAQSIILLMDFFDVLHELFLNIRQQQGIELAGAVKVKPEFYFSCNSWIAFASLPCPFCDIQRCTFSLQKCCLSGISFIMKQ